MGDKEEAYCSELIFLFRDDHTTTGLVPSSPTIRAASRGVMTTFGVLSPASTSALFGSAQPPHPSLLRAGSRGFRAAGVPHLFPSGLNPPVALHSPSETTVAGYQMQHPLSDVDQPPPIRSSPLQRFHGNSQQRTPRFSTT
jgi:hypothetical protein